MGNPGGGVNAVGSPSVGGVSTGGAPGGVASGGIGVAGPGSVAGDRATQGAGAYAVHGIYFRREWYPDMTDCLNAASGKGLPLDVCH